MIKEPGREEGVGGGRYEMITNRSKCVLFLAVCKKDASLLTTSLEPGRGVEMETECAALNSDASPPPPSTPAPPPETRAHLK